MGAKKKLAELLPLNMLEKEEVLIFTLTLLHSEQPKLYGVLAVLSAIGLMHTEKNMYFYYSYLFFQ